MVIFNSYFDITRGYYDHKPGFGGILPLRIWHSEVLPLATSQAVRERRRQVFCQRQEADTRPGINSDLMVI